MVLLKSRKLARACDEAIADGDWPRFLALSDDAALLNSVLRLVPVRIQVARELGDEAALERTAAMVAVPAIVPAKRQSFARAFNAVDRADLAWSVLVCTPDDKTDPGYATQASRILRKTRDPALRAEIAGSIRALGHAPVRPAAAGIAFPPSTVPRSPGRVTAGSSPQLDPRHRAAFDAATIAHVKRASRPRLPTVGEYRNVFVDPFGQVATADGTIVRTRNRPLPPLSRSTADVVGEALHAVSSTKGIYHWMVDRVPLFGWLHQPDAPRPTVLLGAQSPAFEAETLAMAGLGDLPVKRVTDPVFVERLFVPTVDFGCLPHVDSYGTPFRAMRAEALGRAAAAGVALPDSLYITRRDSVRRPLINEAEVEAALTARGFTVVTMSAIPLWHQVALAASARRIAGTHGAGLAHLMYARPDCEVTELIPIKDGSYGLRFLFAQLSTMLGLRHRVWLEPQAPNGDAWTVETGAFLRFLDEDGA